MFIDNEMRDLLVIRGISW